VLPCPQIVYTVVEERLLSELLRKHSNPFVKTRVVLAPVGEDRTCDLRHGCLSEVDVARKLEPFGGRFGLHGPKTVIDASGAARWEVTYVLCRGCSS
jgi:hypothetical protein